MKQATAPGASAPGPPRARKRIVLVAATATAAAAAYALGASLWPAESLPQAQPEPQQGTVLEVEQTVPFGEFVDLQLVATEVEGRPIHRNHNATQERLEGGAWVFESTLSADAGPDQLRPPSRQPSNPGGELLVDAGATFWT